MKLRTVCAGILALALVAGAQAADLPPLVDIATAEAEIAQLDKDMAALAADNDKLNADTKEKQAAIETADKELKDLNVLIDNSRYQYAEMIDFRQKIRDDKLLAKVNEALGKLTDVIAKASEKRNGLNKDNDGREATIKSNKEKVALNTSNIDRKNSRKTSLLASIERTKVQDAKFQEQMAKVDAFLANAPK